MPLINFYQLKKMSNALQSYDAEKVQTKVKKPADAGNYTVEELFGKTADDIDAVKQLVEDFKAKKISDVVRLELQIEEGKVIIPEDLQTKVPGINLAVKLPAYTVENDVLTDETGARLMVDLKAGTMSGTPSVVDADASAQAEDGKIVYKQLAITSIKVFPVGEWTLESLPKDALLDNDEIQSIAYRSAVDQIVIELAKDKNLIVAIKNQIGPRILADALADKVDVTDLYSVADGKKTPLYRTTDTKIARTDLDSDLLTVVTNEEQLEKDVDDIQKSYDASKVLVENTKLDGTHYSVEEVLAHKILVQKRAVIDDLTKTTLSDILGDEADRAKKDVVRVYDEDGSLLYTKDGEPLELNLETGELSSTAYMRDRKEYLEHHKLFYVEYKGKACIYPQIETTLLDLLAVISEGEPAKKDMPYAKETNRILTSNAPAWTSDHAYHTDDVVAYEGKTYICKKPHVPDVFDRMYWMELSEGQTVFGYMPELSQVEKKDVVATKEVPVTLVIQVKDDGSFCFRPLSVLRRTENKIPLSFKEKIAEDGAAMNTVIKPKKLFSIDSVKNISNISVETETAGTSKVMLAVTNDNEVFQAYDKEKKSWTPADTTTSDAFIATAMEASTIKDIPADAWKEIGTTKKMGFAYLLHQEEKKAAAAEETPKDADASTEEKKDTTAADTTTETKAADATGTEAPKADAGATDTAKTDEAKSEDAPKEDDTKKEEPAPEPDVCKLGEITLTAYPLDYWKSAILGTDYDYEYRVGGSMVVNFMQNGDYKVNYESGYRRGD